MSYLQLMPRLELCTRSFMELNNVEAMRHAIEQAKAHEEKTQQFSQILNAAIPSLHGAICLPQEKPVNALLDFITRYIEHVPDFIEAMAHITESAKVSDYTRIFLNIAKDFFLNPPEIVDSHMGMQAMLDEAYLAHRLMEEVNDRFLVHCGVPLTPMDMTRANLVVHTLIGEAFANELDLAVQYSIELCTDREVSFNNAALKAYLTERQANGWKTELATWPCLADDLAITLNFSAAGKVDIDTPEELLFSRHSLFH